MRMMDRLARMVGYEVVEEEETPIVAAEPEEPRRRRAPLVSLATAQPVRVVVMEPTSYEQAPNVVEHLKNRRPVVLNLEGVEKELAQKILDFLAGAITALDGDTQRVGNGIFLFVPNNVEINMKDREEIRERGFGLSGK